jgi:hypothetical protein
MTRRTVLPALLVLIGLLLIAPIVLLVAQGAARTPEASASPTASSSAVESLVVEPSTGIEQAVWWRTGWRELDDPSVPDFDRLTVGRVDGEILGHVDLGPSAEQPGAGPPFVVGPRMGMLLYAVRSGMGAELHLFDAASEEDRVLATVAALLHHAALAPHSGFAYFATGPGSPGIWRVALNGTRPPELVAEPPEIVGARPAALLTAPIADLPKQVTLLVDESEEMLAAFTCTDRCVLRVFDLRTDEELEIGDLDPGARVLTDFIDGVVVINGGSAFDVAARRPVPPPAAARTSPQYGVGWEVPPGWRIEERAMGMGSTRFFVIDPDGNETPVDVIGQGVGNG